jgi:hypothetical protein
MISKIKMPTSNWWTVQNYDCGKELDFTEFCKRAAVEAEKYAASEGLVKEKTELVLDKQAFLSAVEAYSNIYDNPDRSKKNFIAPILSYHCTTSTEIVGKIMRHGYRRAGDLDPEAINGLEIKHGHGNLYGDGVYTSSSLIKAASHTRLNIECKDYVFVNLVIPGAVKFFKYNHMYENLTPNPLSGLYENIIEYELKDKKKKKLQEKYDTLAVNGLEIIVSSSGDLVVPVFLLTFKHPFHIAPTYLNSVLLHEAKLNPNSKNVVLNRIFDSFYTLDLKSIKGNDFDSLQKLKFLPVFVISRDWLVDKRLREKLQSLIGAIHGDVLVFILLANNFKFFKCSGDSINLKSIFDSLIASLKARPAPTFAWSEFKSIFSKLSDDFSENEDVSMRDYVVIQMFVCLGTQLRDFEAGGNAIFNSNEAIRLRVLNFDISYLALPEQGTLFDMNGLLQLKQFCSSNYSSFASIYEDKTEASASGTFPIEKQILKDISSFNWNSRKIGIPNFLATINSGIINDLDIGPTPFAYSSGPLLVKLDNAVPILKFGFGNNSLICTYDDNPDWNTAGKILRHLFSKYLSDFDRAGRNYFRSRGFVLYLIEGITMMALEYIETEAKKKSIDYGTIKNVRRILVDAGQLAASMKAMNLFNPNDHGMKWYKHLLGLKFSKSIAKRTCGNVSVDLCALGKLVCDADLNDASEALLASDTILRGLSVRISNASQVEPWLLIIERIWLDEKVLVRNVYLKNEGYCSSSGLDANGYLLLSEGGVELNELQKIMFAYLFTGNPYLFLPSQQSALVGIVWVRVLEELLTSFRKRKGADPLRLRMLAQNLMELNGYAKRLPMPARLSKLLSGDFNDSQWRNAIVSEKEGALSLCIVLVAIMQNAAALCRESEKLNVINMAVLQESVNRSVRVYIRSRNLANANSVGVYEHLAAVLGLDMDKPLETGEEFKVDLNESIGKIRSFFLLRQTNCTPFGVVACLGYIFGGGESLSLEEVVGLFENGSISMRKFIESFRRTSSNSSSSSNKDYPLAVQLALYLNGFSERSDRDLCSAFEDPFQVISRMAARLIEVSRNRNENENQRIRVQWERHQEKMLLYEVHALQHSGEPVMFRRSQLSVLNSTRQPDNQLELADGYMNFGLLKFHCCYPNCPDFLGRSFCDRNAPSSRRGLFKHLSPDQNYHINYTPAFHVMVNSLLSSFPLSLSREDFRIKMQSAIQCDGRMQAWVDRCPDRDSFDETLDSIYEQVEALFLESS